MKFKSFVLKKMKYELESKVFFILNKNKKKSEGIKESTLATLAVVEILLQEFLKFDLFSVGNKYLNRKLSFG